MLFVLHVYAVCISKLFIDSKEKGTRKSATSLNIEPLAQLVRADGS